MILFCTTHQSDNSKIHASEICVLCLDFFQTNNFSIFPHHPYTNLSGINLHRCCKIHCIVLFVVLILHFSTAFVLGVWMMYWCWWRDRRCSCLNNFHEFPLWRPLHFTSHSINMIIRNVQKGLNQ